MNVPKEVILRSVKGGDVTVSGSSLLKRGEKLKSLLLKSTLQTPAILLPLSVNVLRVIAKYLEDDDYVFDRQSIPFETAIQTFSASKNFEMNKLKKVTLTYLKKSIIDGHVCHIYDWACIQQEKHLEYLCWKEFDISWKKIFESEDFFNCQEATIRRLLICPIYSTLSELDLLHGIYRRAMWKVMNGQRLPPASEVIRPLLPAIRLLTIDLSDLEKHVFNLGILTPQEINWIRSYFINKDLPYRSCFICNKTAKRNMDVYHTLFDKWNCHNFKNNKNINVRPGHSFRAKLFIRKECFAYAVKLPIRHQLDDGIGISYVAYKNGKHFSSDILSCNKDGEINLNVPEYLKEFNIYDFTFMISGEYTNWRSGIYIISHADCYICKADYDELSRKESKEWFEFYCDILLQF
ncbi:uncharacterized protein LOC111621632 [Centruroides sculpturatus]|uniref:uncharacterized protein LOC111621632 n=1 Tax=Centruroides sculpturatus TaxID=218467 RepID=UPI000C6EBE9D|nr:uncharacterized protein LOC111621632 [Centruroides sculpturatus]